MKYEARYRIDGGKSSRFFYSNKREAIRDIKRIAMMNKPDECDEVTVEVAKVEGNRETTFYIMNLRGRIWHSEWYDLKRLMKRLGLK